jgi:hypothetical protein
MTVRYGISAEGPSLSEIDRLYELDDFSDKSLMALIGRIERSHAPEHLIYRESELDEVWRLVESALREVRVRGGADELESLLLQLRDIVVRAHDFVGVDGGVGKAAAELRGGIFLALKCANLLRR